MDLVKRILTMKTIIFALLFLSVFNCNAVDYVTVVDDCPVVTFTSTGLTKVSVNRKQIKVQKVTGMVIVTIISDGAQVFTWNEDQAQSYGGRTIAQLYTYILTLITNPC